MPNDSERTPGQERVARKRKASRFAGLLVMMIAFPPFINSMDNPRVAMLHGLDVFRLLLAGSLFGLGLGLLLSDLIIFRGE